MGKAVFFDLDETLIEHTIEGPELIARIHAAHVGVFAGVDAAQFGKILREKAAELWGAMFDPVAPGEDPLVRSFGRTLKGLGLDSAAAQRLRDSFVEIVLAETRPNPGAKEALARLRADGLTTGIITNGYTFFQNLKINHHGFAGTTDFVLVSEAAGAHKPDPRIFRLALERAEAAPGEALHIGDHLVNDIGGAEQVGISGVLYDPHGDRLPADDAALPEGARRPSHILRHWDDLPDLLQESVAARK